MMMYEVVEINTWPIGSKSNAISIAYQSPEWAQVIERGGKSMLVVTIYIVGSAFMAWAVSEDLLGFPLAQSIVAGFAGSLFFYWLGYNINRLLQNRRAKRGLVKQRLDIKITPKHFTATGPDINLDLPRKEDFTFTALPHRNGKHEEREEQRLQRRLGHSFRDAFEIWLQAGHRFERIAAVSDEKSARAIVRHCQEANELASRGARQQTSHSTRNRPV